MTLSSWPFRGTAASSLATPSSARKRSPTRLRTASPPGLTRPFTLRATLAPSTAMSSRLSTRFAPPVSTSSACSPRRVNPGRQLLVHRPRIEDRCKAVVCAVRLLISLVPRRIPPGAVSWPGSRSTSGRQETRYGDGCWRRKRRSARDAQCGAADRYPSCSDYYFHGHFAGRSEGLGHARSTALAEPAAERRACKQNRGRP